MVVLFLDLTISDGEADRVAEQGPAWTLRLGQGCVLQKKKSAFVSLEPEACVDPRLAL